MIRFRLRWVSILALACVLPADAQGTDGPGTGALLDLERPRFFRSNADYMALDALPEGVDPTLAPGWVLQEQTTIGRVRLVERTLYRDGAVVGTEREEIRADGLPAEVARRDATGAALFRETYAYRADGTLRTVRRCGPSDECTTIRYALAAGPGVELIRAPDHELRLEFDDRARPTAIVRRFDDGTLEEERRAYAGGALIERRVARGDTTTTERFADGLVVERTVVRAGRTVERATFTHDDQRRLVTRRTVAEDGTTTEEREYGPDESLRVERRLDGVLRVIEVQTGDGARVITRFRGGRPILREHTDADGRLVRRETLRNGIVVDVETFDGAGAP